MHTTLKALKVHYKNPGKRVQIYGFDVVKND